MSEPVKQTPTPTPTSAKVISPVPTPVQNTTPAAKAASVPDGKLRVAKGFCIIDVGHWVPVKDVTPAEALLLTAEFRHNAKGMPLKDMVETGLVERSAVQEIARLTAKYGKKKVVALFPGALPTLPKDYEEAASVGAQVELPVSKLGSFAFGDKVKES